jgi:hypothetical protein
MVFHRERSRELCPAALTCYLDVTVAVYAGYATLYSTRVHGFALQSRKLAQPRSESSIPKTQDSISFANDISVYH